MSRIHVKKCLVEDSASFQDNGSHGYECPAGTNQVGINGKAPLKQNVRKGKILLSDVNAQLGLAGTT